ncbi:MAG: hypothetical protein L6R35_001429 [Caloplaca aegaea]|nr:MAG: hypothetical protein L6R35_001429 [Caloplaca aegaea]
MEQQSLAGTAPNNPNQEEPTESLVSMIADWRQKKKDEEDDEDDKVFQSYGLKGRRVHQSEIEVTQGESPVLETATQVRIEYTGKAFSRKANANLTGIPESWLSAMKNQVSLAELITDRDESALGLLTENPHGVPRKAWGFRLIFEFAENDYFANQVVTKTYYYQDLLAVEELLFKEGDCRRPNSSELRPTFTGGWNWCSLSRKHKLRSAPPSSGLPFTEFLEPLTAARSFRGPRRPLHCEFTPPCTSSSSSASPVAPCPQGPHLFASFLPSSGQSKLCEMSTTPGGAKDWPETV